VLAPVTLILVQPATVLAELLDGNGLPDVALAAGVLDEGGRVAEGGEGEGGVGAGVAVGVVAAHCFPFLSFFFVLVRWAWLCCLGRLFCLVSPLLWRV
jgi:hypothetical protein